MDCQVAQQVRVAFAPYYTKMTFVCDIRVLCMGSDLEILSYVKVEILSPVTVATVTII